MLCVCVLYMSCVWEQLGTVAIILVAVSYDLNSQPSTLEYDIAVVAPIVLVYLAAKWVGR